MNKLTRAAVSLLAPATALLMSLPASDAFAAGPQGSPGKPGAPVELRWLDTGTDGHISVEVVSAVDYDALELRLLIPGLQGAPEAVTLDEAEAGAARRVDWHLAGEPQVAPRVLVILEADGRRLGRVIAAPDTAKRYGPAAARSAMPEATPDGLIEMRGETSHRREPRTTDAPE